MLTPEQLAMRRKYIGSSDVPQIILDADGVPISPFGNPGAVYWSKVEDSEQQTSDAMDLGNWLEEPLIKYAEEQIGIEFARNVFRVSPDNEIMAATHDGINVHKGIGCEAKYVSQAKAHEWGEEGTGNVPLYVYLQCQHQMSVSALRRCVVPTAVAGYSIERRIYIVERDEAVIAAIVSQAERFWLSHIIPRVPPEGWTVPPIEVLKERQRVPGKVIELPRQCIELAQCYTDAGELIAQFEEDRAADKEALLDALGDADTGILPDGRKVTWYEHDVSRFDSKRFKAEQPELAAKYIKVSKERRFNIEREKDNGNRIGTDARAELPISSEVPARPEHTKATGSSFAIDNYAGTDGTGSTDCVASQSEAT